ncbi:MAG: ATP-dependent 26S proteasome regulatory subunit, partial [Myxococcota bacterium]
MQTNPDLVALNARFIDAMIRRWEFILEHQIHLRGGNLGPDDVDVALEAFRAGLEQGDSELDGLRNEAGSNGWVFPLDQVVRNYELEPVETQILQLSLMPMLDLTFRRRIARFNNNILMDFVDVDLALLIMFPSRIERLQARAYFASDASLVRHNLVALDRPKDPKGEGALAQELRPPERLADYILCRRSLDTRLRGFAELVDPVTDLSWVALESEEMDEIRGLLRHFGAPNGDGPFVGSDGLAIGLVGPAGTGKTMLAEAIANALKRPLIRVDSGALAAESKAFSRLVTDLFAEARVQGAVLLFDRCEPLFGKSNPKLPSLLAQLERHGGLTVIATAHPDELDSGIERYIGYQLNLSMPDVDQRHAIWQTHIPTSVAIHPEVDLEDLASRYELTGGQISRACELAEQRVGASGEHAAITQEQLKRSAQSQIRANMDDLSVKSKNHLTLDDLVLPDREMTMVQEVLTACRNRIFVMSKWGFGKRLVTGKGICVLFKGEPGTGKTLCAEILASEMGMKLYQVSIPKIVSKYVGETEKNISKIFASARANHSMLLFDEADSLFGKRVDVQNSIDRFSNMETNLLLQEIERFEGICILTTNLDKNMDDA